MTTPSAVFGNPPVPSQPGPCIFGIGYCSPVTNNVLQSVQESLTTNIQSQLSQVTNSMGATISESQSINFNGATFNCPQGVNLKDFTNVMNTQINLTMVTSQMTQQQLNQLVATALTQTQKDGTSSSNGFFSGGNNADTLNLQQTFSQQINNLSQSVTLQQFNTMAASVSQQQNIGFAGVTINGSACNLSNFGNTMTTTLLAQMLASQITSALASLVSKSTLAAVQQDTTSNVSTGPLQDIANLFSSISTTYMILIIGVVLVLIIAGMILRMGRGKNTGETEEVITSVEGAPKGASQPLRNEIAALTM